MTKNKMKETALDILQTSLNELQWCNDEKEIELAYSILDAQIDLLVEIDMLEEDRVKDIWQEAEENIKHCRENL